MSESERPIRFAVIGLGMGYHHCIDLKDARGAELAAVCDPVPARVERAVQKFGVRGTGSFDEILADPEIDVVNICTPSGTHSDLTCQAMRAGKHVVCEKPPGVDLAEGQAFLALGEQFPDRKVLIAENFFYRDDLRLARSLLDAGKIGPIHLMAWRFVSQLVPREGMFSSTPWRQVPKYRGGPQLDAGVHHLAQIRLLCGEVQDLHAYLQYANPTTGGPSDMVLNLRFSSGAIGSYTSGHLPIPTPGESTDMRLYGSEGLVSVGLRQLRVHYPSGETEAYQIEADGGYYNELLNFYEALVFDEPIVGTIAQSYENLRIVMEALDSAEEHQVRAIGESRGASTGGEISLWRPRGASGLFDGLPCRVVQTEGKA